jgi:hypothetical protein
MIPLTLIHINAWELRRVTMWSGSTDCGTAESGGSDGVGTMLLIIAMLALLIGFFGAFVGLIRFAEHVIRPRGEADRAASRDAAS